MLLLARLRHLFTDVAAIYTFCAPSRADEAAIMAALDSGIAPPSPFECSEAGVAMFGSWVTSYCLAASEYEGTAGATRLDEVRTHHA